MTEPLPFAKKILIKMEPCWKCGTAEHLQFIECMGLQAVECRHCLEFSPPREKRPEAVEEWNRKQELERQGKPYVH